jgi:endonuclease/exonuclease/phosphatase (EEP) superfamily protein YafD
MERLFEHALKRLGESLADADKRRAFLQGWFRRLRWAVRLLNLAWLLTMVLLWAGFRWVGEGNLTLAFFLFVPPTIWLLPLIPLGFLAVVFDWRSLPVLGVTTLITVFGLMGLSLHGSHEPAAGQKVLTILTYNRGENANTSLQPFKNTVKPDVVVLQDAAFRSRRYVSSLGYEEFAYGDDVGEFTLISRYPVTGKDLVQHQGKAVAARFTLDVSGTPVAVYVAHLDTPREPLMALRRGAFLWGILGPLRSKWAEKRDSYEGFWDGQIAAAETIITRAEAETIPCLIAGDFNSPAQGRIHRRLTRTFTDSHDAAGLGFGYTFPGVTRNPLSLGGPWMRLDKVLGGPGWKAVWSRAEKGRPSQHCAMAAQFALETK